jgi:3-oxoacyl-(acyl-carrier-protein) synthase
MVGMPPFVKTCADCRSWNTHGHPSWVKHIGAHWMFHRRVGRLQIIVWSPSSHLTNRCESYLMLAAKDPEMMSKYTAPGIASTMLSNRISWFFDLKGASVTLDTACSSSMVALDMACQGLWNHTANTVRICTSSGGRRSIKSISNLTSRLLLQAVT